jgi:hypothetical protein
MNDTTHTASAVRQHLHDALTLIGEGLKETAKQSIWSALAALDAPHTACLAQDGWKLMPPKLTPEMIEAMWDAMPLTIEGREDDGEATDDGYTKLYLAALAAAPEPPDTTVHRGSADLAPWLRHVGDCPYADLNLAPSAMERECTCGLVQALTGHQSCPDEADRG